MNITGGRIIFGRTVQPAQYESKKSEVELAFTLAEGEELGTSLDIVGAQVQAKALELVGLRPSGLVVAKLAEIPIIHDQHGPAAPAPVIEKTTTRKMPSKKKPDIAVGDLTTATPAQVHNAIGDVLGDVPQIRKNPEDRKEPEQLELADAPITDKDLGDLCNRAAGRLLTTHGAEASKKVRELIQKYAPRVAEIAADKRKAFKAELEALK